MRASIDLDTIDKAYDRVMETAGQGTWRIVSIAEIPSLTHALQESPDSGVFETGGDNPVAVLAVVEEA